MSSNPFSPPRSDVDTGLAPGQMPWHMTVMSLGMTAWGAYRVLAATVALAGLGTTGMALWVYYLALLPGLVCICAGYALWRRSAWFMALVVAVPPLSLALTLIAGRPVITLASSYFGQLSERVPPWQVAQAVAAIALLLYGGFLRKWGWLR